MPAKEALIGHINSIRAILSQVKTSPEKRAVSDKLKDLEEMIQHHGKHLILPTDPPPRTTGDGTPAKQQPEQKYGVTGLVYPGSGRH